MTPRLPKGYPDDPLSDSHDLQELRPAIGQLLSSGFEAYAQMPFTSNVSNAMQVIHCWIQSYGHVQAWYTAAQNSPHARSRRDISLGAHCVGEPTRGAILEQRVSNEQAMGTSMGRQGASTGQAKLCVHSYTQAGECMRRGGPVQCTLARTSAYLQLRLVTGFHAFQLPEPLLLGTVLQALSLCCQLILMLPKGRPPFRLQQAQLLPLLHFITSLHHFGSSLCCALCLCFITLLDHSASSLCLITLLCFMTLLHQRAVLHHCVSKAGIRAVPPDTSGPCTCTPGSQEKQWVGKGIGRRQRGLKHVSKRSVHRHTYIKQPRHRKAVTAIHVGK